MFECYMYLAVENRESANQFLGHVLSDEWNPHYYENNSGFAVQPKEKDNTASLYKGSQHNLVLH